MEPHPEIPPPILEQIAKLERKYEVMGQDLSSYLDGLLYANYLTYWDYIHLDTLLSLQNPKTDFPDEKIFIAYHQITELYLNLALWELQQLAEDPHPTEAVFLMRLKRCIRYFRHLVGSFGIMAEGMEQAQFLKFRMSLLPASGFQSVQFRQVEIAATELKNLVDPEFRAQIDTHTTLEEMYDQLYWKRGATELATGKKTLTLKQFEVKYRATLVQMAQHRQLTNPWRLYRQHFPHSAAVTDALRTFDAIVNVDWGLAHYAAALRYLHREPAVIEATGGTNWQKYLPPKFQKIQFYPELWTEEEKAEWGKTWVVEQLRKL
ncbi:MAG: tryptophan 2,3-dioxygenase family protein [Bernardetiaceae bacterium]|jgi:tryptophan 2,3-dioxygenase|nr:tryptophan 2,3-dioxygenase family protein [Bernardetiaceae bacterium]